MPTGVRLRLPADAAFSAAGETIMPARSDRIAGIAESGAFSFSVTCIGPLISTEATVATSALMFDFGSVLARSRLNFTASASSFVPS